MNFGIGVDLGGTNLRAALIREDGEIVEITREKTPVKEGPQATASLIARMGAELAKKVEAKDTLNGLGIGSPGPLSRRDRMIYDTPNLPGFDRFPIGEKVQNECGIPVRLDNDAKCAAYGEEFFGVAKGAKDFVLLTFGTGVGAGVVSGGRMLYGKNDGAAELGHITLYPDGVLCKCGNRGCVEKYVSATAIEDRATLAAGKAANAKDLIEAFDEGKDWAKRCMDEVSTDMAIACASLVNVFNPEMIVLGGGVFTSGGGPLCTLVQEKIRDRCFKSSQQGLRIVASTLGGNAGVLGAASLVLRGPV